MKTLYTLGYTGAALDDLKAYAAAGALILDTRLSPNSRVPQWRQGALQAALLSRYAWAPSLGNTNFRSGGPIQIADPATGLPLIAEALAQGPVVLLCACADPLTCHRSVVAELARETGICKSIVHLRPGDPLAEVEAGEGEASTCCTGCGQIISEALLEEDVNTGEAGIVCADDGQIYCPECTTRQRLQEHYDGLGYATLVCALEGVSL